MKLKKIALVLVTGSLLASTVVSADYATTREVKRFKDYATVTHVEPVYRTVRVSHPRRECWDEERTVQNNYGDNRAGGTIVGGILGGVAGHQVGKGRGKAAATIIGTLLGSKIGRDMSNDGSGAGAHTQTRTVCRTVDNFTEEERLQGYRVSYRYQGHEYTTMMSKKPGNRIRIKVKMVVDDY